MAKQTQVEKPIPALYKRSALNQLMYGFVKGCRATLHTVTVEEAIRMFMETFELDHDDYNFNSAMNTFFRIEKDLFTLKKYNND